MEETLPSGLDYTTPWTLPSNVALCVNAAENYVFARLDGRIYILAEALASVLGEGYEIIKTVKGKELCGIEYEPLFDFAKVKKARLVCGGRRLCNFGFGQRNSAYSACFRRG